MPQEASAEAGASRQAPQMKITLYDQVSGLLIALLGIVGATVLVLAIAYLSQSIKFDFTRAVAVIPEEGGGNELAQGLAEELEEPGVEEMPDVMEPQIAATLDNVVSVVKESSTTVDALAGDSTVMGKGTGLGDARSAGPGGPGIGDVTPRWERWQVRFSTTSVDAYAKQLDFFAIELAAIGGGSKDVEYASLLSKRPIQRRVGAGKDEKRLFMTWTKGALRQFDIQLLQNAGIAMQGRECIQLYPPATEAEMAKLESAKLAGKPLKSVKRTVFAVRSAGSGYEMYVADQQFR
jgi:hypothetical protein